MSGITQEDREAAAELFCKWFGTVSHASVPTNIRAGIEDDHDFVQAFAQHHLVVRNAALKEAAKVVDSNRTDDDSMWDRAAKTIARMIRTLSTQDTSDMRATNKGDE